MRLTIVPACLAVAMLTGCAHRQRVIEVVKLPPPTGDCAIFNLPCTDAGWRALQEQVSHAPGITGSIADAVSQLPQSTTNK